MRRLLMLVVVVGLGCDDGGTKPKPEDAYLAPTSPENVLENLQAAYRRREPDRYAALLHSDFLFYLQSNDAGDLGQEFWDRNRDMTQTAALFRAEQVSRIDVDLTYEPAVPVHAGSDTMFIRVNPTFLEVDEEDEQYTITWRVLGDIQDMLFVRGEGPDSTRWYLLEWRDLPEGRTSLTAPAAVRETTWGKIKTMGGE